MIVSAEAFEDIVREYHPKIKGTVFLRIGDGTPAFEDVIGDVHLSLWKTLSSGEFRGDCSFGTLIHTIVHARLVDYIRQKAKMKGLKVISFTNFDFPYVDDFIKRFEIKELLRLYKEGKLKPRKRKKRVCEFDKNDYDESKPKRRLPWWGYLSYHFTPF